MSETRPDLIVRSLRTILPGGIAPASVYISGGVITDIRGYDELPGGCRVVDCKQSVLMPGLVDPHVHVNDPGRTEWEGFDSATRAAASGGVTTFVDMPLNSIPATTSLDAVAAKKSAAAGHCWMNVELWGGVVPGNTSQLEPMWRGGVLGFKCFLVPSGVAEFECVTERDLREAMPVLAKLGAPLLVHAELPGPIDHAAASVTGAANSYANYLRSRPREAELDAIALMLQLCAQYGTRVHIVHLAAADAVPMLRKARASGLPVTVETCPHYLSFASEEIPDGATHFKCAPPIRERENRERLWMALDSGVIDFIATDHSPCPAAMKHAESGDFSAAWGGVASMGLALPVVWTAARARHFSLERVTQWLSTRPAQFCGLGGRLGKIAPGYAADLVVWDPEQQREWRGYHKMTPYANEILYGVVEQTYLGGRLIFDHGGYGGTPQGRCGIYGSH